MKSSRLLVLVLLAAVAWYAYQHVHTVWVQPIPIPVPVPRIEPRPTPHPKPKPKPWGPNCAAGRQQGADSTSEVEGSHDGVREAGPDGPDHDVQMQAYLDPSLRLKNVGGRDGAGLCVFTSLCHAGRFQNEPEMFDFQKKMRSEAGGGYPEKVTRMMGKYAPDVRFFQYEGSDPAILLAALRGHRMPGITYNGHDMHYGWGQGIAHMVNLVHADEKWFCVLDNNFIGDEQFVWLTPEEFLKRWKGGQQGWAVVLLAPPPPPEPWN